MAIPRDYSEGVVNPEPKEPPTEPTQAARRVHRAVMEALMLVYDEDKKSYHQGYTDQRIAEETGAALANVQKTRQDYFGPLSEPGELAELRREIEQISVQAERLQTDAKAVAQGIRNNVLELQRRLSELSKKNGWA